MTVYKKKTKSRDAWPVIKRMFDLPDENVRKCTLIIEIDQPVIVVVEKVVAGACEEPNEILH